MYNKAPDVLTQVVLPSQELSEDMAFFSKLGFRLDNIFPADDPAVAIMSGYGLHLRIDKGAACPAPNIHLLTDDPEALAGGNPDRSEWNQHPIAPPLVPTAATSYPTQI